MNNALLISNTVLCSFFFELCGYSCSDCVHGFLSICNCGVLHAWKWTGVCIDNYLHAVLLCLCPEGILNCLLQAYIITLSRSSGSGSLQGGVQCKSSDMYLSLLLYTWHNLKIDLERNNTLSLLHREGCSTCLSDSDGLLSLVDVA